VLSGLANTKSLDALTMAAGYLQDKALLKEAESAVVTIAGGIYETFPKQTMDVLKKIVQSTSNEALHQQAQEIINKIEGSSKQVEE
jgi:hypothetical protein